MIQVQGATGHQARGVEHQGVDLGHQAQGVSSDLATGSWPLQTSPPKLAEGLNWHQPHSVLG